MRARVTAITSVTAALISAAAFADDEIAISKQAILLLKILKFDRNLEKRAGGTATVAVLYQQGNPEAEAQRAELVPALESAARGVRLPVPVKVVAIPYSASKLEA